MTSPVANKVAKGCLLDDNWKSVFILYTLFKLTGLYIVKLCVPVQNCGNSNQKGHIFHAQISTRLCSTRWRYENLPGVIFQVPKMSFFAMIIPDFEIEDTRYSFSRDLLIFVQNKLYFGVYMAYSFNNMIFYFLESLKYILIKFPPKYFQK